jgi:hypothetical protein
MERAFSTHKTESWAILSTAKRFAQKSCFLQQKAKNDTKLSMLYLFMVRGEKVILLFRFMVFLFYTEHFTYISPDFFSKIQLARLFGVLKMICV